MRFQGALFYLSGFLFCLVYLLPHHYEPWMSAFQDSLAFSAALLFICVSLQKKRFSAPLITVFFFAVSCIPLIQYFCGLILFEGDAWLVFLYLSTFSLVYIVSFDFCLKEGGAAKFLHVISMLFVFVGVISVWLTLRQWLLLSGSTWELEFSAGSRPYANIAQPNSLASLLLISLICTIYLFERRNIGKLALFFLALFFLFGIALTLSRTPWLSFPILFMLFFFKSFFVTFRMPKIVALGGTVLFYFLVFALPSLSEFLLLSFQAPAERAQSLERLDLYQQFIVAVAEGPAWGYGWNQISLAQIAVIGLVPLAMMTYHSHNVILDLLLWNGPYLGGAIVIVLAGWLLNLIIKTSTRESFLSLLVVIVVLVHGMLEFPLEYAYFLLPVGVFLGVASAEPDGYQFFVPRVLVAVFICFLSLLGGRIFYEYVQLEDGYRIAKLESVGVIERSELDVQPRILVLDQIESLVYLFRLDPESEISESEMREIRDISFRYPGHYSLHKYASVLSSNGCGKNARYVLSIIKGLHGDAKYEISAYYVLNRMAVEPKHYAARDCAPLWENN